MIDRRMGSTVTLEIQALFYAAASSKSYCCQKGEQDIPSSSERSLEPYRLSRAKLLLVGFRWLEQNLPIWG